MKCKIHAKVNRKRARRRATGMGMGRADKQIIQQHTLKKRQRRCEQQRRKVGERGKGGGSGWRTQRRQINTGKTF